MSGSKRYFRYRDDLGNDYAVQLDESNSEATIGGEPLMLQRNISTLDPLPTGLKPRYIIAQTTLPADLGSKVYSRKFKVGNPAAIVQAGSGAVLSAQAYPGYGPSAWTVTFISGEQRKVVPFLNITAGDSGLDDNDQGLDQAV
jgi:hypothetical protein